MDVLVDNFIKAEERNFNMFSFVNEQSQEIETLESEITSLKSHLETIKDFGGDVETAEAPRRKDLR